MEELQKQIQSSIFIQKNVSFELFGMKYITSGVLEKDGDNFYTSVKDENLLIIKLKLSTFNLNNCKMTYTTRLSLL